MNSDSRETAAARLLRHRLTTEPLAALVREIAGTALVLDDAAELAGGRRTVEAEDLDGLAGRAASMRSPR